MKNSKYAAAALGMFLVLGLAGTALATVKSGDTFGPAAMTGADNGSCGNTWANDTWDRSFIVDPTPVVAGTQYTYDLTRYDKEGDFVTVNGISPGACDNGTNNGNTIVANVKGHFHGYVNYRVVCSNACYDKAAGSAYMSTCSPSCSTAGFIAAAFPGGTYGSGKFSYVYNSRNPVLCLHHWTDVGFDGTSETFTGDIASTCN
jgi:hypothetical protein